MLIALREGSEWSHDVLPEHEAQIRERFPTIELVVARGADIETQASDADIIAGFPARIPRILPSMPVRWIHSFSAGVDKILTPEIKANDTIIVSNSSGIHAIPITEHVIGMIIAFNKQFPKLFAHQREGFWQRESPTIELYGKRVLIVGLGAIGTRMAEMLKALGCVVDGVVRTNRRAPDYLENLYTNADMDEGLRRADYVICCLPGSPETSGMFNRALFEKMKPEAVFVNIGRGSIVNQEDLIDALNLKTIAGALLDVTTPEPLPADNPLWNMHNVIITPHCSASSPRTMDRIIDRLCLNIDAFLKNDPLPNEVNKTLGY